MEGNHCASMHALLNQACNTKHLLRTNHVCSTAIDAKTGGLNNMIFINKIFIIINHIKRPNNMIFINFWL